jgi:Uma2 family endonuclease
MSLKAKKQKYYTPEEYLVLEESAEFRSEFDDGEIVAMAGSSIKHFRITKNIEQSIDRSLSKGCESFSAEVKVRVERFQKYYYPDIFVVCGEPIFDLKRDDTIVNPILIIEVLSKSTEAKDRGEKMLAYRSLESLQEYVLVSQDKAIVEQYSKDASENWIHKATIGLQSKVFFESIKMEITLEDIYKRIEL